MFPRPYREPKNREPYQAYQPQYATYGYECESPVGYHRYQSNTCDPTQDELPITLPDPNEGIPPAEGDPLVMQMMTGSMPCGKCNQLNYCQ
jgi:hypothetical protein